MQVDYYKILGISRDASTDQIRQAYRLKAKQYHPDINKNENAKLLFQLLNEAYQVLINPEKKRWYDFKLKYPSTTTQKPPADRRTATYENYYRAYTRYQQEKQEEKEFVKYKKSILDKVLFYFLVVAGVVAIISSVSDTLFAKWKFSNLNGVIFGVWFLGLMFYGWNLMSKK